MRVDLADYSKVSQSVKNFLPRRLHFAILAIGFVAHGLFVCCVGASPQESDSKTQLLPAATTSQFDLSGQVTRKSDDRFEVKTAEGKTFEVNVNESTDFALRMANPWFDVESRQVVVDGKPMKNGKRERIRYPLPDGKLYLLAEYRSVQHRNRLLQKAPWRINNYLISDKQIESTLPKGEGLLLSGELDLENSAVIIDGKSWPIKLGFRGATLRGRYFEDIFAGDTYVMVTGSEEGKIKTADTVIFMIR